MAIVVEDGSALSTANSYASIAEGDAYYADYYTSSEYSNWTSASTATKEVALKYCTRWLDNAYRGYWRGRARLRAQALAWPRYDAEDEEGYWVDSESVPEEVKSALFELVLLYLAETDLYPTISGAGPVKREKVEDAVEVEYFPNGLGEATIDRYPAVERLLSGLVEGHRGSSFGTIDKVRG